MSFLYLWLRTLCYYVVVWPCSIVIPFVKNRLAFERENHKEPCHIVPAGGTIDYAFEVSSEGELEQVITLMEMILTQKKKVQLIFSSPSVEKKCMELTKKYRGQLFVMRLPILSYRFPRRNWNSVEKWLQAPVLVLCRYDFFPEFFFYAKKKRAQIFLLSATVKGLQNKMALDLSRTLYLNIYRSFSKIVAATEKDEEAFIEKLKLKNVVGHYDFRILGIRKRLDSKEETLRKRFPFYNDFKHIFDRFPMHKRFIWGSFWPNEMDCFDDKKLADDIKAGNILCFIAPHDLDYSLIGALKRFLLEKRLHIPCYHIYRGMEKKEMETLLEQFSERPGIVLVNLKGVLCELYAHFGHGYVGGGHGRSVHSLIEPFLAGCHVYCGPLVHRSTEFDFINAHAPERVTLVPEKRFFYDHVDKEKQIDKDKMNVFTDNFKNRLPEVLERLEIDFSAEEGQAC